MKKLFYLLFLLPLALLASCSSDDDLPQVNLTLTASNVYQAETNGPLYYVVNDEAPLTIDGLTAQSLIDGKPATIANDFYSINGRPILVGTEEDPNKAIILPGYLKEGTNYIHIYATVLQVDKSIAECALDLPVVVVSSEENLPESISQADLGTHTITITVKPKK